MAKGITFIVGAGRSGTTLLYKILSLHPEVGYITNYDTALLRYLPTPYLIRMIARYPYLKKNAWSFSTLLLDQFLWGAPK